MIKKTKFELTPNQVNDVNAFLSKLPKVTLTAEEAVNKWATTILDLVNNKGYTYAMICEILAKEKNIHLTESTLATYIKKYKQTQAENKPTESNV